MTHVLPSRRALATLGALVLLGCGSSSGSGSTSTTSTDATTGTGGSPATTGTGASGATGPGGAGSGGTTGSGGSPWTGPLPEGDHGIAAHHPGDVGIASDAAVVFADDFEGYAQPNDLWSRYDNVYQLDEIAITTAPDHVHRGAKALEFALPVLTSELANSIDKVISPERDVLFLRYYSRFESPFDVTGSSHNGGSISAHYFMGNMATPGVPANGTNKFLVNLEDWRSDQPTPSPGPLNVYVYWPEQRSMWGDHFFGSGMVLPNSSISDDFGPGFVSRPDITPALDHWYCYELMVKANTVGQRDGRIAFWLDGKLAADFGNLRFRDVASLTIDHIGLMFHAGANPGLTHKWYDDLVVATSYIGPVFGP
jgi:hypothetical protein